jgi:D-alanine-D-alanine ligase
MAWQPRDDRPHVAVLAGGDSAEREVSLASGSAAVVALRSAGYAVSAYDPAQTELADIPWSRIDVCFLALHGGTGEDGRIQRRLELLRVPYTGSRPVASRLAMSKSASKERFAQCGVPTLPYVLFHRDDSLAHVSARTAELGWPRVVKPDSQGSSLGVTIAQQPSELAAAVHAAGRFDPYLLAEPFLAVREVTVSVLGRRALPVLEIERTGALFDYRAKYQTPQIQHRALVPGELPNKLAQVAVAAADALGTKGLVRVDLLVDEQQRPWVLEVNTLPGMTEQSLAPRAAQLAGMSMTDLCDWMVRDCLAAGAIA